MRSASASKVWRVRSAAETRATSGIRPARALARAGLIPDVALVSAAARRPSRVRARSKSSPLAARRSALAWRSRIRRFLGASCRLPRRCAMGRRGAGAQPVASRASGAPSAWTRPRKRVAAHLEIGKLVEGGAGGGQQHHRLLPARRRVAPGLLDGAVQRAAAFVGGMALQGAGEIVGRLADKIRFLDVAEEVGQRARCRRPSPGRRRSSGTSGSYPWPGARRRRWWPCCR